MTHTVQEVATDYEGRARVAKLNIDVAEKTAQKYGVWTIPTLIIFHEGKELWRVTGVVGKSQLTRKLDAAFGR